VSAAQLVALSIVLLIVSGLILAFVRGGVRIKPDPENKPPSEGTFGGS
jgi:hypothetical protein